MRRYLYLTDDCGFFTKQIDGTKVILTWNSSIDLSIFKWLGLLNIHIGPLVQSPEDYIINVYCNLISRTIFNPNRELASIQVARGEKHLPNQNNTGVVLEH